MVQAHFTDTCFSDVLYIHVPICFLHLCKSFAFLTIQFYLYPTITMDYTKIGFEMLWENEPLAEKHSSRAVLYGIMFLWFSGNLLVSIIRTIGTNPGNIPEEKEWDMSTDAASDNERDTAVTSSHEPE